MIPKTIQATADALFASRRSERPSHPCPALLHWSASTLSLIVCTLLLSAAPIVGDEGKVTTNAFRLSPEANAVVETYCLACHDEDVQKGDIRLDHMSTLSLDKRLTLLNKVQEQVYFGEMPPKKKKSGKPMKQPSEFERAQLADWVSAVLKKHDASQLEDKMRYPDYGNYVDHDKLFSGEITDKPYTPKRRWLVSPQIFSERVLDIFQLTERERNQRFYGVTNPFVLLAKSGVRYYDNSMLDGGHLLVMLSNAEWISKKQLFGAIHSQTDSKKIVHENPKDKWSPRKTPAAYEVIVQKDTKPSAEEINAAIHAQFSCVLQRQPTEHELENYHALTTTAIDLAGNAEGLRQMLKAVLLEEALLYRYEFGAGEVDEYGRQMLSPREASYAISYALGDRGPDPILQKAAKNNQLQSPADYKREIERLLADSTYYKDLVDPTLSGKSLRSHVSTHPKIVRFFREFFGYAYMGKVFKDRERSDGFYQNAGRGTAGTAGRVTDEADKIVDLILQEDTDVFARLLTTDEYYVYDYDQKRGAQTVAKWRDFYERHKDTDWLKNEAEIVKASNKLVALSSAGGGHTTRIDRFMKHMDETIGKGREPFPVFPWAHGYSYNHSQIYNFPKLPKEPYKEAEYWGYPLEQPFKVANRKGILTHPAWLVAHSQNAHTDPVVRGRWIREKLLAGRVPDVPITVDAQVPEDPHKTLRERFDDVTGKQECWKCHQHMNPLGYPFESFDDFGRFRILEELEHPENVIGKNESKYGANRYKTKPVNAKGNLYGTGDPSLDGDVKDAFELIDRLAKSDRVRQSIIRNAFRFYLGRNETLSDSQTLINADKAYVANNGSFKAVIVSLLTSDSFLYRK